MSDTSDLVRDIEHVVNVLVTQARGTEYGGKKYMQTYDKFKKLLAQLAKEQK